MIKRIKRAIQFVRDDIWRIRSKELPLAKSFLITYLRVIILSLRKFVEDKCQLRASALTFYTLLSIVPLFAMAFAVAEVFGLQSALEAELTDRLKGHEEIARQIIVFARTLLENTKGGVMAGIGIAVLIWTVIKVLGNIEHSFNDIWGVRRARTLARKFSDYVSTALVCPLLLVSVTAVVSSQIKAALERSPLLGEIGQPILALLDPIQFFTTWLVFTLVYVFMPNTRVRFRSGLLAGVIAGTLYQVGQHAYVRFQIGTAKYNAIYGTFAALPLFLIWLQVSWLIVLFGAQLSFAHQNVDTYEFEPDCLEVSHYLKKLLALRIVHLLVQDFRNAATPRTAEDICHVLAMPIRLVNELLYELVEAGIVSEMNAPSGRAASYQPGRAIALLTVKAVIDALEQRGSGNVPVVQSRELEELTKCLEAFGEAIEKSPQNMRLRDL